MKKIIPLMTVLFILSANNVMAQGPCKADFDCNGGVDAGDVGTFLEEWNHRTIYNNPCTCVDTACLCNPARVPKTGQTTQYAVGDDGDLEKGVPWPSPRFTDNEDGTVTDNLTGLMWMKRADGHFTPPWRTWQQALDGIAYLNGINFLGYSDWRLPNVNELVSLIDRSQINPALPLGHPFTNVSSDLYWSSTSTPQPSVIWTVGIAGGIVVGFPLIELYCVWPVRGGQ